jgi:two-component system, NtrC family, sensor kinase
MLKTIHSKFVVITVIFILLVVGIPTTFLMLQFRENFSQRSDVMLNATMDVVNSCINNAMMLGKLKHLQTIVDNVSLNTSVSHVRIFSPGGMVRYATDTTEIGKSIFMVSPGHVDQILPDKKSVRIYEKGQYYSMVRPILNGKECQPCHADEGHIIAYVDVDTDLTQAERYFLTGSMHMVFLAIAIIITLFFGFYYIFNRYIRKPLLNFRSALDKVHEGNLEVSLPARKDDEIGALEDHFNHMVSNLRDSKEEIEELHFEQLQRADKMVTLGELAAEMAHEINNPAGIIMSRADYIQMSGDKVHGLKQFDEDLSVIINQIEKISKITGNILKYSRKLPKEFKEIDLKQLVEESMIILGPRMKKNKIDVDIQYDTAETKLNGDPLQIEQVLTNLINNAIDAMPEGGVLSIRVLQSENKKLEIHISDNGPGMDDKLRQQIFTPFYTTKKDGKGTGLGLYIVKNICKNHGAEIFCDSEPGEGTTFRIVF